MSVAMETMPGDHEKTEIIADVAGNRLTFLPDGPDRLDRMIARIGGARSSIRALYYIFVDDASGRRVRDALIAAADRGVEVSLLVDGFGSDGVDPAFFRALADSNVRFCRFEPRLGRRYLLRNHQKLLIADGRQVLLGGFNVADDYFGTASEGAWRDVGLEVDGPSVHCLADYFDTLFAWTRKPKARIRDLRRLLSQHSLTTGKLHWLFGGPTRRLSPWALAVKADMAQAARLDLVSAYFAPGRGMLKRIRRIGRRGRARLITAAKSDNNATIAAARHTYARLLKSKVEVYEYQATKLHTKLVVVDDVTHVGSANFDIRSFYLNLEVMLRIDDAGFARRMRDYVDDEVGDSLRVTEEMHRRQRTLWRRFVWGVAYFIVAVADYNVSRRLNFGVDGR